MKDRRVRFTATVQEHVREQRQWWLENRLHSDVFAVELDDAIRLVALLPGAGTPYPNAGVPGLRRLYLSKVACHLYYTFDQDDVIVRAIWGARRHHGPSLEP